MYLILHCNYQCASKVFISPLLLFISPCMRQDAKTLEHMNGTTLDRFKIVTVQDAQALLEGLNIADTMSSQDLSKSGMCMILCVCLGLH